MLPFSELIQLDKPVLVDFFATWCGPCKMMTPILSDIKKRMGDSISIIKIDVDKNPATAASYQIQGVPALLLFKEGRLLWREAGVIPAAQLEAIIKQYAFI